MTKMRKLKKGDIVEVYLGDPHGRANKLKLIRFVKYALPDGSRNFERWICETKSGKRLSCAIDCRY